MQELKKILKTHGQVLEMLEKKPKTRDNDALLFAELCYKHAKKTGDEDASEIKRIIKKVLVDGRINGFPNFETMGRARRKIQARMPELQATEEAKEIRRIRRKAHKAYSKK